MTPAERAALETFADLREVAVAASEQSFALAVMLARLGKIAQTGMESVELEIATAALDADEGQTDDEDAAVLGRALLGVRGTGS